MAPLQQATRDPDPDVREAASAALEKVRRGDSAGK
jgi:HEAT repeat protein